MKKQFLKLFHAFPKSPIDEAYALIKELINGLSAHSSEGDVYRLIMKSKLPSAEKFESWVFDEVLPTIRKTGGYINNVDLMVNTYFSDIPEEQKTIIQGLLTGIEEKQNKIKTLSAENDLLSQKVLEWVDRPLINAIVRAYGHGIHS